MATHADLGSLDELAGDTTFAENYFLSVKNAPPFVPGSTSYAGGGYRLEGTHDNAYFSYGPSQAEAFWARQVRYHGPPLWCNLQVGSGHGKYPFHWLSTFTDKLLEEGGCNIRTIHEATGADVCIQGRCSGGVCGACEDRANCRLASFVIAQVNRETHGQPKIKLMCSPCKNSNAWPNKGFVVRLTGHDGIENFKRAFNMTKELLQGYHAALHERAPKPFSVCVWISSISEASKDCLGAMLDGMLRAETKIVAS